MKILHIEDDSEYAFWLRENLEIYGIETTWIGSATAAIEELQKNPDRFDLIIVDGDPGELEGHMVVNEIRSLTMSTPILTQSDSATYIQKQFAAGSVGAIPRNKINKNEFYKLDEILRDLVLRFKS